MLSLLFVGTLIVAGLLMAAAAALLLRGYRDKITKALVGAKNKFFWGGFVRSQSLAYATTGVQLATTVRYWRATGDEKALSKMAGLAAWLLGTRSCVAFSFGARAENTWKHLMHDPSMVDSIRA